MNCVERLFKFKGDPQLCVPKIINSSAIIDKVVIQSAHDRSFSLISRTYQSTFSGILTRHPFFLSVDTCPSSEIFLQGSRSTFAVTAISYSTTSADTQYSFATLSSLICPMSLLVSSVVDKIKYRVISVYV